MKKGSESILALQAETINLTQYEALPEDIRVEVFDGVIYNITSPSQIHQSILISKEKKEIVRFFSLHLMYYFLTIPLQSCNLIL